VPYRVAAPPEPDPVETDDPYVAVLRSQRRRARLVSVLVAIFLAGGLAKVARSGPPPRRAKVAEAVRVDGARAAIEGARARASVAQSRFEIGVREAIADDVVARPDLGACPIMLPSPSSLLRARASFPLLTVERSELEGSLPSQAVAGVLADVRRAESHLAADRFEEAKLYGRALDRPERFGYDVVLVARATKKPQALSGNAYEPGEIAGQAYVYDFASGRVVCTAEITAKSSKEIGYVYSDRSDTPPSLGPAASMGDAIHDDIRLQTERAIVAAVLWRSGPRLRESPSAL
jgi:hypothetical protein